MLIEAKWNGNQHSCCGNKWSENSEYNLVEMRAILARLWWSFIRWTIYLKDYSAGWRIVIIYSLRFLNLEFDWKPTRTGGKERRKALGSTTSTAELGNFLRRVKWVSADLKSGPGRNYKFVRRVWMRIASRVFCGVLPSYASFNYVMECQKIITVSRHY